MTNANETCKQSWQLDLPLYDGGLLSPLVDLGGGVTVEDTEKNSKMQVVRNTCEAEFQSYLEKLEACGFVSCAFHEINGNRYAQYKKDEKLVYAYYTDAFCDARIIEDKASVCEPEFEYMYSSKNDETATVYQYGMMYDVGGNVYGKFSGGKYSCGGNFYIIRLSDNRLIMMDGGVKSQVTDATLLGLLHFLHDITKTREDEKIRVACYFISHAHNDHREFFDRLIQEYSDHVELERVMYNIPREGMPAGGGGAPFVKLGKMLVEKYPDLKFIKPHTGQDIQMGDARMEILFTHEDMIIPETGEQFITEYNNVSTVIRMTLNGRVFMWLGDWGGGGFTKTEYPPVRDRVFRALEKDGRYPYLESDVIQVAHHAVNGWMSDFFNAVGASIAFVPQGHSGCAKYMSWYQDIFDQVISAGAKEMYFSGELTHGLTVYRDGTIVHESREIEGLDEGYLEMYEASKKM